MSLDDISLAFDAELGKLQSMMSGAAEPSEAAEIVEIYHQVINVSSMCVALTQQIGRDTEDGRALTDKIAKAQRYIAKEFDSRMHPRILERLSASVQEAVQALQSGPSQKSPEEIKRESFLYEDLRKRMSTKEFVEQYQKGLSPS